MNVIRLITLLIVVFFSQIISAEGWDDYKNNTISKMLQNHENANEGLDYLFMPGLPFKTKVRYLASTRNISDERIDFISKWVKTHGLSQKLLKSYSKEILFEENNVKIWLPIQDVLIPYLRREVPVEEEVVLFVVLAGAKKNDWVFLINEFNTI